MLIQQQHLLLQQIPTLKGHMMSNYIEYTKKKCLQDCVYMMWHFYQVHQKLVIDWDCWNVRDFIWQWLCDLKIQIRWPGIYCQIYQWFVINGMNIGTWWSVFQQKYQKCIMNVEDDRNYWKFEKWLVSTVVFVTDWSMNNC